MSFETEGTTDQISVWGGGVNHNDLSWIVLMENMICMKLKLAKDYLFNSFLDALILFQCDLLLRAISHLSLINCKAVFERVFFFLSSQRNQEH